MARSTHWLRCHCTAVAWVMAGASGAALAQTASLQGSLSLGLVAVDGGPADRALFGQYTGQHPARNLYGTLAVDLRQRDAVGGTWAEFHARDLLGNGREAHLFWQRPGDWKVSARYGEGIRYEPHTLNTGLLGAGSTRPEVVVVPNPGPGGSGSNVNLQIKRTRYGIGWSKWINAAVQFELDLQSEDKDGARLFGAGMTCPSAIAPGCGGSTETHTGWAVLLLPEPINANHTQVQARLNYAIDKLRLSAGYHGSFYRNRHSLLAAAVPGSLNNALGDLLPLNTGLQSLLSQPLALLPDNQAHHFDLSANVDLTPTTRASFKLGYALATQRDSFAGAGLRDAPAGAADLGGRVNTTLAQIGITARPARRVSLLAKLRYEDKNDRTPIALYNIEDTATYTNRRLPSSKLRGKLQANYQFTSDYRGSLALDHEAIDRGVFTATSAVSGISALRQKTDETSLLAQLRRRMSANFSGALSVVSSRRTGSNWLRNNSGLGVTEVADPADPASGFLPTAVFMPTLADRRRDKFTLFAQWQPSDDWSLQLSAEQGQDTFTPPSRYGLRHTRMNQISVDWDYTLSSTWAINGYASHGRQTLNQARPAGYILAFENTNTNLGLGLIGKPLAQFNVGAGVAFVNDRSVYAQTLDSHAGAGSVALLAATGGLPDVVYRQLSWRAFGEYALDRRSSIRVDLSHQRSTLRDWTWGYNGVPFVYSDGTTVWQSPTQSLSLVGIAYRYQWL